MSGARDVVVVGAGRTVFGRQDGVTGMDMAVTAVREALDDSGLAWSDMDRAVGGSNVSGKPDTLVSRLGLTGLSFTTVRNGCATGGVALDTAVQAIRSGAAETVCVVGFDKHGRGAFNSDPASYGIDPWYGRSGLMVTTQYFALKTTRYLHDHGIGETALAGVAARAFENGRRHPLAWRRTALTEEEILAAPMVNDPLTKYMFCSPGEGAVALVLTTRERAADLTDAPVRLASVETRSRRYGSFEVFSSSLDREPFHSPSVDAAAAAFAAAGVRPADVEVAQLQDTDSGSEIIHMAETGLTEHGSQGELVSSGATSVDGRLPINTDGGCLAAGEPIGASGLRQVHEVVRQLQGRAPGAQVPGEPRIGFTHVYGAPGVASCTVLMREDS